MLVVHNIDLMIAGCRHFLFLYYIYIQFLRVVCVWFLFDIIIFFYWFFITTIWPLFVTIGPTICASTFSNCDLWLINFILFMDVFIVQFDVYSEWRPCAFNYLLSLQHNLYMSLQYWRKWNMKSVIVALFQGLSFALLCIICD